MSELRPFPDRPSLEFDRKAAKALLRQLRAGETHALERAHARGVHLAQSAEQFALADAQLIIAREYGFASWPRLVQYHGDIVRQARALERNRTAEEWASAVKSLKARHGARHKWAARTLAAFVPRLYGMTPAAVLDVEISEDDARLAVAREAGQPSWNAALAAKGPQNRRENYLETSPWVKAAEAIEQNDISALETLVRENPELLERDTYEASIGRSLANFAFGDSKRPRRLSQEMRRYLEGLGFDLDAALNMRLCNRLFVSVEDVQYFLELGADPDWIAPNGFSVFELALLMFDCGPAVDLIAARATRRNALWIAAGTGDVQGVAAFLDADGKPTKAAREIRSPFDAVRPFRITPLIDPDHDELMIEVLSIAAFNARANVIDYLASRGVNLDNMAWGVPIVNLAVGNGWYESAAALVRNGANLDIPSQNNSNGSAREMARDMWTSRIWGPKDRRMVELCGLDPDALLAEQAAVPPVEPEFNPALIEILALARQDAIHHRQSLVFEENFVYALLRRGELPALYLIQLSKLDRERFRADLDQRIHLFAIPSSDQTIALSPTVQALLDSAVALTKRRRSEFVQPLTVLYAMTQNGDGFAVELVKKYGGSVEVLNEALRKEVLRNS